MVSVLRWVFLILVGGGGLGGSEEEGSAWGGELRGKLGGS